MNDTQKQPNCEERIDAQLDSTLDTLRLMLLPEVGDVRLIDDGTLDTVIGIGDVDLRYSQDERADWTGDDDVFDGDAFIVDHWDELQDQCRQSFDEYGLSFDYVTPDTTVEQESGYFRYQISWGGPSSEIRFFVDRAGAMYRAEYVFMDWFDGASRSLHEYWEITEAVWRELTLDGDPDTLDRLIDDAM